MCNDCENAKRKNIMYIFNDRGFGGAGQSLLDTLREIGKEINPVVVVRDDVSVEGNFRELGISCYQIHFTTDYIQIGESDEVKKRRAILRDYEAALQLLPIIQKEKIELIHINSSVSNFAAVAALMAQVPYVWHIRELLEEQFGYEFINGELKNFLYAQADTLVSISDYVQKRYEKKYGVSTTRIYNGFDIRKYKLELKERKNFKPLFLVAAMITPEKGQWDVICAVENLMERGYTDVKVIIAGDGKPNYIWALKKYIKKRGLEENISILPFQENLVELRKQASYAITSSQNEALGRVTVEAMLAGNLVIGAKSGGTLEIIGEEEERGFLYELHNSEDLANAMLRAIQYPEELKNTMRQKAQMYAENTFDSRQYGKGLLKLYDEKIASYTPKNVENFLLELKKYKAEETNFEDAIKEDGAVPYKRSALLLSPALRWLEIRQKGHSLEEYFLQNHIYSIAIYGMGLLGCRLYDELENSKISIAYLLDKNPGGMEKIFEFASLDGAKLKIDAVVVSVISGEQKIIDEIYKRGYEKVIGLNEVLDSFFEI